MLKRDIDCVSVHCNFNDLLFLLNLKTSSVTLYRRHLYLVKMIGLEPTTSCMSSKRSNQLSYTSVPIYITIDQANLQY